MNLDEFDFEECYEFVVDAFPLRKSVLGLVTKYLADNEFKAKWMDIHIIVGIINDIRNRELYES